jgi:hypothetical protein
MPRLCSGAEAQGHLPPLRRGQRPGSGSIREKAERARQASNYWSSTTNANNTNNAWIVNFNNGNVNNNNKTNNNFVIAVRGGS